MPLLCIAGAQAICGAASASRAPPAKSNELTLQGRGVFACISPWNFPLAIFAGQVTAALAAGNAVVAKPAEPTPLIAARFIRLLHEAGVAAASRAPGARRRAVCSAKSRWRIRRSPASP